MSSKRYILSLLFILPIQLWGQKCTTTFSGFVIDLETGFPITNANVHLEASQNTVQTDSSGFFTFKNVCKNGYHITISHIGCETQKKYIEVIKDTSIVVYIDHFSHALHGVTVEGQKKPGTQSVQALSEKNINENLNQSLGNMLQSIVGVRTLRNGSGIAKPIVNGMYGSRLLIVNNGVPQSGQQWGNDHSPEIDPFAANKIMVIKGAAAIEYQGSNLGSVVLVEPNKISTEPHLHGKAAYYFESNGRGHGFNAQANNAFKNFACKLSATYKKSGDTQSPSYFLTNTGSGEKNLALQLEKTHSTNWNSDLYFSTFNTEIGILRGSHISNLTDLNEALRRDVPLFTRDTFDYAIASPRQKVSHHLLKVHTKYFFNEGQWMDIVFASQFNTRKEYDVRRAGRSTIPSLSIQQYTQYIEGRYAYQFNTNTIFKTGLQSTIVNNINNPETGILPLIPDYNEYDGGIFGLLTTKRNKWEFEFGLRYDLKYQKVALIENTLPRKITRYNNLFNNMSAVLGSAYRIAEGFKIKGNIGGIDRSPAINELYSLGLHQGVSGIEEGSKNLGQERSLKGTLSIESRVSNTFFIEALTYYQLIKDYIFLKPQDEIRLTLRGAFPVYKYEKTDAKIYGIDLSTLYNLTPQWMVNVKYSYIRGYELKSNLGIINLPSSNVHSTLKYSMPKWGKVENIELECSHQYTFRQNHILASQDYVSPPSGYHLFNAKVSLQKQLGENRLVMYVKSDNLLNAKYRDYLNRQRYFADDLGRSVVVGVHFAF
jgi:iron complex outermembrane recepter protein